MSGEWKGTSSSAHWKRGEVLWKIPKFVSSISAMVIRRMKDSLRIQALNEAWSFTSKVAGCCTVGNSR